nr:immunoglobulin heavy chain junction region [Mus musculus]
CARQAVVAHYFDYW